ncbi:hypothetical protein IP88_12510 [alpha proteobacterium AAP81b]|nr:hypothetical protein IP88_12510 [alpha proteobacterium AAP81b]
MLAARARACRPAVVSLYRRLLGSDFDRLPPLLRDMHAGDAVLTAAGEAVVERGANRLARLLASAAGFPPAGRYGLQVTFTPTGDAEVWTRRYGDHVMTSRLAAQRGRLVERFGPFRFAFTLTADAAGLAQHDAGWWCLGVPLPRWLGPRTLAREWQADGRFCLDVAIELPLLGLMVAYRGWLVPIGAASEA